MSRKIVGAVLKAIGIAAFSTATVSQLTAQPKQVFIHGYLDAHWEYPNLVTEDVPGHSVLPFVIRETRWQDVYIKPVAASMAGASLGPCFRVVGKGFVAPRTPTNMWPADTQFVFTKIKQLKQLASRAKCESGAGQNVR